MNLDQFKKNGKFLMLALDHRESFKKLINPKNPDLVSDEEAINLKSEIIKSLEDEFSSLLVDIKTGLPAYKSRIKPFLLPVEKSGFVEESGERITKIEFSVNHLKELGAGGAKLLLYFNPNLESAKTQIETARKVLEEADNIDFPLFFEFVTYSQKSFAYDPQTETPDKKKLILDSLDLLLSENIRPDVYKLEYPGSLEGCKKITEKLKDLPWILLTGGVSFEKFDMELKDAIEGGAQGFLAGRAIWQEVCKLEGEEKEIFLKETLPNRFKEICKIATS